MQESADLAGREEGTARSQVLRRRRRLSRVQGLRHAGAAFGSLGTRRQGENAIINVPKRQR